MRKRWAILGAAALSAWIAAGSVVAQDSSQNEGISVVSTMTLPAMPIGEALNGVLGEGTISDDLGIPIGGTGSDLWRSSTDPEGEYWMVTDRGPNVDVEVDGEERLTFPIPNFTPTILHVRANGDTLEILEIIPVTGTSGDGVTGVSSSSAMDPQPYGYLGESEIPYNPNGMDVEGLVRTADGGFWLAEEYSPSLVKLDATGEVLSRYVPEHLGLTGTDYPVEETLPEILLSRRGNRGFEGLGITPDGSTLVAILQSPLSNPDKDTGAASRVARILVIDSATGKPTAEYAYEMEDGPTFDTGEGIEQGDMKLSGVVAIDADSLIVLERTDDVARLYSVELSGATNILGTAWDDVATTPSLESSEATGFTPVSKTLLADLAALDLPTKIEGLAIIDAHTIAIANDNDFDLGSIEDGSGNWEPGGKSSQIIVVSLPDGIPGLTS